MTPIVPAVPPHCIPTNAVNKLRNSGTTYPYYVGYILQDGFLVRHRLTLPSQPLVARLIISDWLDFCRICSRPRHPCTLASQTIENCPLPMRYLSDVRRSAQLVPDFVYFLRLGLAWRTRDGRLVVARGQPQCEVRCDIYMKCDDSSSVMNVAIEA